MFFLTSHTEEKNTHTLSQIKSLTMTFKINDSQDQCQWPNQVSMVQADAIHTVPVYDASVSQTNLPSRASHYRFPAESTGNRMRPWRKGGGASCPSTAENVSPLSWAANHIPACDCIFYCSQSGALVCQAMNFRACNAVHDHNAVHHCTSESIHFLQDRLVLPTEGPCVAFIFPDGHVELTYRKVIQGNFWKSETKQKLSENLPSSGFKKMRNTTCTVQKKEMLGLNLCVVLYMNHWAAVKLLLQLQWCQKSSCKSRLVSLYICKGTGVPFTPFYQKQTLLLGLFQPHLLNMDTKLWTNKT